VFLSCCNVFLKCSLHLHHANQFVVMMMMMMQTFTKLALRVLRVCFMYLSSCKRGMKVTVKAVYSS